MILTSDKISLRPFSQEDLDIIHSWRNSVDLRHMALMHPYPVSIDQDKQWLAHILSDTSNKNIVFAVELNQTKELFGYFQLTEINLIHRHSFLGIVIGNKKMRGQGLGKQIMELGLNYGFAMLGLQKISLEVLESNEAAITLYQKLGFVTEGKFEKQYFFNGAWHNVIRMAKFN